MRNGAGADCALHAAAAAPDAWGVAGGLRVWRDAAARAGAEVELDAWRACAGRVAAACGVCCVCAIGVSVGGGDDGGRRSYGDVRGVA